jgi:hypothetical protein
VYHPNNFWRKRTLLHSIVSIKTNTCDSNKYLAIFENLVFFLVCVPMPTGGKI